MRDGTGARLCWTFRAHRGDARRRDATRSFWGRRLRWRPMRRERFTRCGTRAARTADLSAYSFLLRLLAGRVGPLKRMSRRPTIQWNTVSRQLPRAQLAMCALHGWTRATLVLTLSYGMFSSAVRATAALPGRPRRNSRAERAILIVPTIMFVPMASASLSAIISRSPSITLGTRTRCGARGGILGLRDRSGMLAGGNCSVLSSQFSVLSSQFSVLSSQFSVLSSQFSVLSSQFSVLSFLFFRAGQRHCCCATSSIFLGETDTARLYPWLPALLLSGTPGLRARAPSFADRPPAACVESAGRGLGH